MNPFAQLGENSDGIVVMRFMHDQRASACW